MSSKILIVDDEESIRYTFSEFLGEENYRVSIAESAQQAIDLLETEAFDVLFLDILLGRESGIDVLRTCKKLHPTCPVIMVTGSPEIHTAADSVRLSACDYLVKPVNREELLQHARRASSYKIAMDEKERYQQRLNAVFQSVQEGIMVFDSSLTLTDINESARRILGLGHTAIGQRIETLAGPQGGGAILSQMQELLKARMEGELYRLEFKQSSDNSLVLSISISPLQSAAGQDRDLVMVLRDESGPVRDVAA